MEAYVFEIGTFGNFAGTKADRGNGRSFKLERFSMLHGLKSGFFHQGCPKIFINMASSKIKSKKTSE